MLVVIVLSAFASVTQAAECQFQAPPTPSFTAVQQPHKLDPFVMERVRGATTVKAFRLESPADGPVKLRWQRLLPATPLDLHERLTVMVSRDEGATFEPYCETGWVAATHLPNFGELKLEAAGAVVWRAEIHEENRTPTMTILDEERPMVVLTGALRGRPIITPAPIPFFDAVRADPPAAPPPCGIAKTAAVGDAVPVKSATIVEGGLQIEGTIYAVSGRTLHVKLERSGEGPPVRILLSAKPVGYGIAPLPVCVIRVAADTIGSDEWISATAPWAMINEFRWQITLNSDGRSPAVRYAVFRERPHSMGLKTARTLSSDAFSCTKIDVERQSPVDPLKAETFQGAYALTIRTNLERQGVTGEAYSRIVDAILTSIDNWRLVCTACTPYQFSVVDIDGRVYTAAEMLRGTPENYRATFMHGYPWTWRAFVQKSTGLFSSALSFAPVSGTTRQRQRFCFQRDEPEYGFSAAESPLCRPSPPSSDQEMVVDIEWRSEGLTCDGRSSVVACWNGTDLIELNLKHYSFYVGDTGDTVLGTAAKGADLVRVFTHEVGHWLGLGHMAGDGNMMSDELARARCIDDRNMRRLNAIAHGEVRRSTRREALRYE